LDLGRGRIRPRIPVEPKSHLKVVGAMFRTIRLGALVLTILLSACMASGPKFSEYKIPSIPEHYARIYFLRDLSLYASGQTARIAIDGRSVGSLAVNGYLVVDVQAGGEHIIAASDLTSTSVARIAIDEGQTGYLLISPKSPALVSSSNFVTAVQILAIETTGFYNITRLEPEEATEKLSSMSLSR
jgi:hypothetical protein